ncbi:MAG TPA: hypothetical protein VE990_05605, partial [Acidimicrobiales bacterium]|nr:hypothetical protein [Acidimicrobiales bacterium]
MSAATGLIVVVCALSSYGATWAPGQPTGTEPLDLALKAVFAATVTAAASRARRWSWIAAAALAGLA